MTNLIDKNYEVLHQLGTESTLNYVELREIMVIHDEIIQRFGGEPGIKDKGLLDSAVNKPMNLASYGGESDPLRLAVSLSYGIIKNHPFHDGNKRSGLMALELFCHKNNISLDLDSNAKLNLIREVARGELDEEDFYLNLKDQLENKSEFSPGKPI